MSEVNQYCTFYLDDLFFGVDVVNVQEVLRYQSITKVRLAPAVVSGLINLRGQIVTAIDLRCRLELTNREEDVRPMNVVVKSDGEVISLLVDSIGDVLEVNTENFESPPETLGGVGRELIKGAYKLDERLLLILDTKKTIHITNSEEMQTAHE